MNIPSSLDMRPFLPVSDLNKQAFIHKWIYCISHLGILSLDGPAQLLIIDCLLQPGSIVYIVYRCCFIL